MLIGMAQGQEGQENLVAPAEILQHHLSRAFDIGQDRAMMLHHAARGAAGAAGIDDARLVAARGGLGQRAGIDIGWMGGDQVGPQAAGIIALRTADRLHRNDQADLRSQHRRHQRRRQLGGRHDHRTRAAVGQDMLMVARRIGGVGRHRDAAGGHDRQIGDAEFRAIFADQHHRVAGLQPFRLQPGRHRCHLARDFGPAQRLPSPLRLAPQEGRVALFLGAGKEHGDQIGETFDRPHRLNSSYIGASAARLQRQLAIARPCRNGHAQ
jgi:hypothetical protein